MNTISQFFLADATALSRCLELLLNEKLGALSTEIARRVLGDTQAMFDVGPALPMNMRESLRSRLEEILKKSQKNKSLGISEIALQLHIGKAVKRVLGMMREPFSAARRALRMLNSWRS